MKQDVRFPSNGLSLAAHLYTPDTPTSELLPAIVVGKPARVLSLVPDSVDESTPAAFREFYDYYKTPRAQHPRSTNEIAVRSVDRLAQFDAWGAAAKIAPRPLLMVAGTEALTLPVSENTVSIAGDNAELFTVEGATHVDLYDKEEAVTRAAVKLTEFFTENLAKS